MKRFLVVLILCAPVLIVWGLGGFVAWEWNAMSWGADGRFFAVFMAFALYVLAAPAIAFTLEAL